MAINTASYSRPETLELTADPESNRLIATDPVALLIGCILDQQVRAQQAYGAPKKLRERLGTLDPERIAAMPVGVVIDAFQEPPPLHRYPASMARRVHSSMRLLVEHYDGNAERIWLEADDYDDLLARLYMLPGIGMMMAPPIVALLARRFGLEVEGFERQLPSYGCLSEVDCYEDLLAYQERKYNAKHEPRLPG